ncbi:Lipase (class 3) [Rubripirellula tenax]|uniref:Lipase (Class 3) n=1 Tax=Rubripirellula tenax TaxID=2528015 RepID=A0A5C6FJY2_9BACT|nr:lipase family protein [Rubripirellula tenax]TWU60369.1 Lipase (class 3) [Rubripirellula tenax]
MHSTQKTNMLDAKAKHNRHHAHYLATACDLAYLGPEDATKQFRRQLGLVGELVSIDNTQAFVGENDGSIVVAFRGSQSPTSIDGVKDWLLTNARNFLVLPEGRIGTDFAAAGVGARFHRGFLEALAEIWAPLYDRIDEVFGRRERPLWVTGHSLGGALALLCAWRLHQQFIPVHQVVTFGAPMIGNQAAADAFAREFPRRIYRYVDAGDLVPRLPMMSLLSNDYNHCETEIVVGKSSLVKAAEVISNVATATANATIDSAMEGVISPTIADAIWGELSKGMPSHLMHNYLARLNDGDVA